MATAYNHISHVLQVEGGGVLILSNNNDNNIKVKGVSIVSVDELTVEKEFECCLAEVKMKSIRFIIAGIYRSPSSDTKIFLSKLNIALEILRNKFKNVIVAGDININVLDVDSTTTKSFIDILSSHDMCYLVNFPTRVTEESSSAIDNFMTNLTLNKLNVIGLNTQISDHDAQLLIVDLNQEISKNKSVTRMCRNFSQENLDQFCSLLQKENWLDVYDTVVEYKFDVFYNRFIYFFNLCFPLKKARQHNNSKLNWLNSDLSLEREHLIDLSNFGRIVKNKNLIKFTKKLKKDFKCKVFNAKRKYINDTICNSNNIMKTTWKLINNDISNKRVTNNNCSIEIEHDGKMWTDLYLISNLFNDYFVDNEVLPSISKRIFSFDDPNIKTGRFVCKPVSERELEKIIMTFENKFSTGFDDVPVIVLKYAKSYLVKPLTHLINSSLISGIFPSKLKITKIKPLYKKGAPTIISNYRPVALLPVISKLYEKVMYNRLVEHLDQNKLFDGEQHGFKSGHSTVSAITDFIDSVISALDEGKKAIGIFMDLKKAFDSVSHSVLLEKLSKLGVVGAPLKWLHSYLKGRTQFVELSYVNNKSQYICDRSNQRLIKQGVPQGSILGPLLFLCYVKGLPRVISNKILNHMYLYADDTNLVLTGDNIEQIEASANQNLSQIQNFLSSHNLLINTSKTNFMQFSTKTFRNKEHLKMYIEQTQLEEVKQTKFLGLIIDNKLSWDFHVDSVARKMSSGLFALYKLRNFCSLETLKLVYFAHIHSHLSYGINIYGATSKKNMDRLLLLQKRAIRTMLKLSWNESVKPFFIKLSIMTIYSLYIYQCVLFTRQNSSSVSLLGDNHDYFTRNRNKYCVPFHNLKLFEQKTVYVGIKCINNLPNFIKEEKNFKKFKKLLKDYIISLPLYSTEDFFN